MAITPDLTLDWNVRSDVQRMTVLEHCCMALSPSVRCLHALVQCGWSRVQLAVSIQPSQALDMT
jgi:hypothetical protein